MAPPWYRRCFARGSLFAGTEARKWQPLQCATNDRHVSKRGSCPGAKFARFVQPTLSAVERSGLRLFSPPRNGMQFPGGRRPDERGHLQERENKRRDALVQLQKITVGGQMGNFRDRKCD